VADFLKNFDSSGNYTVDKRELATALGTCGINLTAKQYTSVFRRVDQDEGGEIDISELDDAVDNAIMKFGKISDSLISVQEYIENSNMSISDFLRQYDEDGSGSFGFDEFKKILKTIGIAMNAAELQLAYDRLDNDGGGSVEPKELQRKLKAEVDAARRAHEKEEAAAEQERQEYIRKAKEAAEAVSLNADSRTKMAVQDKSLTEGNLEDDGTGRRRKPHHVGKGIAGTVLVKSLTRTHAYQIGFDDSVKDLKDRIEAKEAIPATFQLLTCFGKEMVDSKTLGDCGLVPGSVVQLSTPDNGHGLGMVGGHGPGRAGGWHSGAPSPGGQFGTYKKPKYRKDLGGIYPRLDTPAWGVKYATVNVRTLRGKVITLDVRAHETIKMLKAQIQDREGIPIECQKLTLNGVTLKDERCFVDCHCAPGAILHLHGRAHAALHEKIASAKMPYASSAALHDDIHFHAQEAQRNVRLGYPTTYRM
jgi:Ca2+-binding EF-hand superfamily protein